MKYDALTLENGIRIIHKQDTSPVGHCGIIINTGARDELDNEHGMAHFVEHMVFKGTKKRKAYHIISRLEDVGGEINAYTSKEQTCVHSTFLSNDFERAIELISDIMFHSTFPEKELLREKEVIIEEINSYKDSPAESIFDDFDEQMFPNDPIGRNILGSEESLNKYKKADIESFIMRTHNTDQMIFCSIGDISFESLAKFTKKYFSQIPSNKRTFQRVCPQQFEAATKIVEKDTFQAHCMMGNLAYDIFDPQKYSLSLLNNILGGPGMNSRLNLMLREKHGLAYNIEANYSAFTDIGTFCVYFGTDKENIERSISLIFKEFEKLRTNKLGSMQLKKAKRQMQGQMAISSENRESLMLGMGKSFLTFNRVRSLESINKKIEAITAEEVLATANKILLPDAFFTLIYR